MNESASRLRLVPDAEPRIPEPNPLSTLVAFGNEDLQEIVEIIRSVCQMDWAAISIIETDTCNLAVTAGLEPFRAEVGESLCHYIKDSHFIFELQDASHDERFRDSPYVNGERLALRAFATAPIYDSGNEIVGRLCVFHPEPRKLDDAQLRALGTLARNISGIIALQESKQPAYRNPDPLPISAEVLQVAAQISHDLRMPITGISMTLDMLEELVSSPDRKAESHLVSAAQRSAKRLSSMVEGLLEIHGIGADLTRHPVDLNVVTREVITELGPTLQSARASLQVKALPTVAGDEGLLFRVLQNLIANAAKFTREGAAPHILISARRRTDAWEIQVTDNGLGVPFSKRGVVFDTFARLHPNKPGNGIGLPAVAQMVRAHGGEVGIRDTDTGQGSEFWFTIPDPTTEQSAIPDS